MIISSRPALFDVPSLSICRAPLEFVLAWLDTPCYDTNVPLSALYFKTRIGHVGLDEWKESSWASHLGDMAWGQTGVQHCPPSHSRYHVYTFIPPLTQQYSNGNAEKQLVYGLESAGTQSSSLPEILVLPFSEQCITEFT